MYQNIYVDYKTRTVHIWDDKLGHLQNPLSKYRYAYQKDPNPEHRLFFVGITRTFENLYIVNPAGEYGYQI